MIDQSIREYLLPQQFNAAVRAGAAIMKIYKSSEDYHVAMKSDHTPITCCPDEGFGLVATLADTEIVPLI